MRSLYRRRDQARRRISPSSKSALRSDGEDRGAGLAEGALEELGKRRVGFEPGGIDGGAVEAEVAA